MSEDYNYAALILSHGRPDDIKTIHTLRYYGYTGDIYIIIDDEDDKREKYHENFDSEEVDVIEFSKSDVEDQIDRADNFNNRNIVLYAREKVFEIAEDLGLEYFIMLDDDYCNFKWRFNSKLQFKATVVEDLDSIFSRMFELLEDTGALTISMAQGGDFIGGSESDLGQRPKMKRKAMNSFFCKTERKFSFHGSINEDVNMYCSLGKRGKLIFMENIVDLDQEGTQQEEGGLTDYYLDNGTYVKSFYTILSCPSFVTIRSMGSKFRRMHHHVKWRYAVPKIVSEEHKK